MDKGQVEYRVKIKIHAAFSTYIQIKESANSGDENMQRRCAMLQVGVGFQGQHLEQRGGL